MLLQLKRSQLHFGRAQLVHHKMTVVQLPFLLTNLHQLGSLLVFRINQPSFYHIHSWTLFTWVVHMYQWWRGNSPCGAWVVHIYQWWRGNGLCGAWVVHIYQWWRGNGLRGAWVVHIYQWWRGTAYVVRGWSTSTNGGVGQPTWEAAHASS